MMDKLQEFKYFSKKTLLNRSHIHLMMTSVVIMAGGEGTRIRPLTFSRPKPWFPS